MALIKWAEALEPGILEWFNVGANDGVDIIPTLFRTVPSSKSSEHYHSFGSITADAWDQYRISGTVANVDNDEGYKTTLENKTFTVNMKILREWIEDDQYSLVEDMTTELGAAGFNKRQTDATSVFINAFTDSTTTHGGDGVELCDSAHPASPHKTGLTQSNVFTLPLDKTALRTIRLAMRAFHNDVKEKIGIRPDTLIVPPDLEDTAMELAKSPLDPESANNTINTEGPEGRNWRVIVLDRLTNTTQWFMVDYARMKRHLIWQERVPLNIRLRNEDTNEFATYVARMRYERGWSDWRWIAGSNP